MRQPVTAERVLLFTDAVVAIAITLLILPLVDIIPEIAVDKPNPVSVLSDNRDQIGSFVLSFVVIARLWILHHRVFANVVRLSGIVLWLNMAWLLTIVVLPFPTDLVGTYGKSVFVTCFYIGTILANTLIQTAIISILRTSPNSYDEPADTHFDGHFRFGVISTVVALAAAMILVIAIPSVSYYALLLLFVPNLVEPLYRRKSNG